MKPPHIYTETPLPEGWQQHPESALPNLDMLNPPFSRVYQGMGNRESEISFTVPIQAGSSAQSGKDGVCGYSQPVVICLYDCLE